MTYTKEQRNEYTNALRLQRKTDAVRRLGGCCKKCGSTVNLEFDHIDPSTKVAAIASLLTASKVIFEAELVKCQLLCKSCHNAKSSKEAIGVHGSISRYQRHNCRCEPCVDNYRKYYREYYRKHPRDRRKVRILYSAPDGE